MSVTGLCQICESREADRSCDRCGRVVCSVHYEEDTGLCAECQAQAPPGGQRPEEREEMPDGVDTYEF